MPRYPDLTVPGLLRLADYIGTASFAASGSLLAANGGMDMFGCCAVGTITAVGGGTVRDILLGQGRRAFWMVEVEYLYICLLSATAAFHFWPQSDDETITDGRQTADATTTDVDGLVRVEDTFLEATDTLGVGAFCVVGAMNGLRAAVPPAAVIFCGISTATFGGAARDLLCDRPVRILHSYSETYAATAASGAAAYLTARHFGLGTPGRIVAGVLTTVSLRLAAQMWDVRLPVHASRKGRLAATSKGDKRFSPEPDPVPSQVNLASSLDTAGHEPAHNGEDPVSIATLEPAVSRQPTGDNTAGVGTAPPEHVAP